MNENFLQKWCDQIWLHVVYVLGVIMWCVFLVRWTSWEVPQRMTCILAILVPLHIFEENTWPGGFFYMNNIGGGSDDPMAYPQSRLTNMVTNFGAELIFVLLAVFAARIPVPAVTAVIIFGIGETMHHTMDGIHMYRRYQKQGKKTLYGPGLTTCLVGLLPESVYGIYWMTEHGSEVTAGGILGGVGILLIIFIGLMMIPLRISGRLKSRKYAFTDKGYFSRYDG